MIEIAYYTITSIKEGVAYNSDLQRKGIREIKRPKTFEELKQEIESGFNLRGKDYYIQGISSDNEEINIKDEEKYNDEDVININKFIVKEEEKDLQNDTKFGNFLDINDELAQKEKEFELLFNQKLNIELNKEELKLDDDEVEKGENQNDQNELAKFLKDLESKIEKSTLNQKESFIDSIKEEFNLFDKKINDKINKLNLRIKNNVNESEYSKKIISEIKNFPLQPFQGEEKVEEEKVEEEKVEEEKVEEKNVEEEKTPVMFSINLDKNKYEIYETEANNIKIEDITIKNITDKTISFTNKYWVKDKESHEDIDIALNEKKIDIENIDAKKEKNCSTKLFIKNPKINQNYTFIFYIGDNTLNNEIYENVTKEPILIYVKIKDKQPEVEPQPILGGLTEERITEIYKILDENYAVSSFIPRNEMIATIRRLEGDINKLNEYVEDKM